MHQPNFATILVNSFLVVLLISVLTLPVSFTGLFRVQQSPLVQNTTSQVLPASTKRELILEEEKNLDALKIINDIRQVVETTQTTQTSQNTR